MTDDQFSAHSPLRRVLHRSPRHRATDFRVTAVLVVLDLLLIAAVLALGGEGVFTEDWLGYPGPVDSTAAGYQAGAVRFLYRLEAVTVGLALACRLWTTAGVQLTLLTTGALFIGSLSTYWTP
jgi:hypothetical protein